MKSDKQILHCHLPFTEEEAKAFKSYCSESGIIAGQLLRRLVIKEIQEKSTVLSADFIPPKVEECLLTYRRK